MTGHIGPVVDQSRTLSAAASYAEFREFRDNECNSLQPSYRPVTRHNRAERHLQPCEACNRQKFHSPSHFAKVAPLVTTDPDRPTWVSEYVNNKCTGSVISCLPVAGSGTGPSQPGESGNGRRTLQPFLEPTRNPADERPVAPAKRDLTTEGLEPCSGVCARTTPLTGVSRSASSGVHTVC